VGETKKEPFHKINYPPKAIIQLKYVVQIKKDNLSMGMGIAVKLVRIIILSKQQQYPLLYLGYPFWSEQYHFVLKDYMIRQNIVEGFLLFDPQTTW